MAYTVKQIKVALKLYDRLKIVRQLVYPSAYTLYEWINSIDATGDKFTYIELPSVKKINLKVRMSNEGYSVERKLEILKQCFE